MHDTASKQKKHKRSKKRQKHDKGTKELKRQKQLKKKTAVTDRTSDDSSDDGPAAIPDLLNPMPDSDVDDSDNSAAAFPAAAATDSVKPDDEAEKDQSKSGKQQSRKRLYQSGHKQMASITAAADLNSGDINDATPSPGSDAQHPASDSDDDPASKVMQAGAANDSKRSQRRAEHVQQKAKRAKHAAKTSSIQSEQHATSPAVPKEANKKASKTQRKRSSVDAQDSRADGSVGIHSTDGETTKAYVTYNTSHTVSTS